MVKHLAAGQSLVEVVFSIGVIILVLTAVISLVVASLHSRTSGYDRKKAAELGQVVMEKLVAERQQNPDDFWDVGSSFWIDNRGTTQVMSGYSGYNYAIDFTQRIDVGGSCPVTPFKCADAAIGVGYSSDMTKNVVFTRFFSR